MKIKTYQDENRDIQQAHIEQMADREIEISEQEDKMLNLQNEIQERNDQVIKVKQDRDKVSQESMNHA